MAPVNRQPITGQETFEGMPQPFAPVRLEARNSLARALRPEYVRIKPEDYYDITPEMVALAAPDQLERSLIDVNPEQSPRSTITYLPADTNRRIAIAVTPPEFVILEGSIKTLGNRAIELSKTKRQTPAGLSAADKSATLRAGVHAVEGSRDKIADYLNNMLEPNSKLIARFQEAADHPGLARFSNEGHMREQLAYLQTFIFGDMLAAIRSQRNWSMEQESRARRALDYRLFLDRANNQHLSNFKGMLALADRWNGHKRAIALTKIYQANRYINSLQ